MIARSNADCGSAAGRSSVTVDSAGLAAVFLEGLSFAETPIFTPLFTIHILPAHTEQE
jgi:hypothetical protein